MRKPLHALARTGPLVSLRRSPAFEVPDGKVFPNTPPLQPAMKISQWAATSAAVITMCAIASTPALAVQPSSTPTEIPATPVGQMSAYPTMVQTGMKPTLTWNILYPSKIDDIVIINPPGSIIVTEKCYVTVQIVGTEVTFCDPGANGTPIYTDARVSHNSGSYQQIFYGTQAEVPPAKELYIKKLAENDTIDFGGRFVWGGGWSPFFTTKSSNFQVVAMVDGDIPPTIFSLYDSPDLKSFLKPYLDASGRVNIGPMSALVMMELGTTDRNQPCYDYQDQILLVTFSKKHPNNGHGNNLDGVDVSNPGQGGGGPNGEVDPSGGYEDEIK